MGLKRKKCVRCLAVYFCLFTWGVVASASAMVPTLKYAKGFTVEEAGESCLLLTVRTPWPGAETGFQYLLKPRGVETPAGYDESQVVEVPIRSMVALSTTMVSSIEQLGLLDRLVGFSEVNRVHSKAIKELAAQGRIMDLASGAKLQVEPVLDLQPDVVFTFATGSFRDCHPKLLEAGLKVAIVAEYMELHPLGRAEWIKFLGLFAGENEKAARLFDDLEQRYLQVASLTREVQHRPSVVTNAPFSGSWYIAGGNSYIGTLLQDSGADYIWKETTHAGSKPVDIELVFEQGEEAEFWLNTGTWNSEKQALEADPRLASFASLRQHRVYNNNRRVNAAGGNDYWESGTMKPDLILKDLIHILHPELLPEHRLYYYKHLQ